MNRAACIMAAVAFLGFGPVTHGACATTETDTAAIHQVIESQLKALQKGDGAKAFDFSTPALKARFRDPTAFVRMVRRNYRAIYRSNQISFGKLDDVAGLKIQHVVLVDTDDNAHVALFVMEHENDGKWRVAGCFLLPSDLTAT